MKIVLQRVQQANVRVDDKIIGGIGPGYVLLLGIAQGDTKEMADKLSDKVKKLRLFPDQNGKTNLSLEEIGGEILVISQFTLYADCRKGNRPSFTSAADPAEAQTLYEYFLTICQEKFGRVAHGSFGADMKVSLVNDGPFTVILDSRDFSF